MLVHKLFYLHASLDTTTLGHAVVKQDKFVGIALGAIPLFNPVEGLVSILGRITLYLKLHHQALYGNCVERVVVDDEHGCPRMPVILLVGHHEPNRSELSVP